MQPGRVPLRRSPVLAAAAALALACAASQPAPEVVPRGFLTRPERLVKGPGESSLLVYVDDAADFSGYDHVLIDPVTLWVGADSTLANVPPDDRQMLADELYRLLRNRLETDFALADRPGPGILRVQVALTEATRSQVVLDVMSTVLPDALLITGARDLASGTPHFVGAASVEARVSDSSTGHVLLEAADRRVGRRTPRGVTDSWGDVQDAFRFWADRLARRLAREVAADRGGAPAPASAPGPDAE